MQRARERIEAAAPSGDAELWRKRLYRVADNYGMVGIGHKTLIEAADRIEALNALLAERTDERETYRRAWNRSDDALTERDAEIARLKGKL